MSATPEIKQQNLTTIRKAMLSGQIFTKIHLARETGLSVATCHNLLNELYHEHELLQVEEQASQGGRPSKRFIYNPDYFHTLCIYLIIENNVRNVGVTVANACGTIIEQNIYHPESIDYTYLEETIERVIHKHPKIRIIGIGVPGYIYDGILDFCDIRSLEGMNLKEKIEAKFDIETIIENDMNLVAYGAYHNTPDAPGSFVAIACLNDEPGSCGVVIDGKIYKGATQFAGELSYVLEENGIPREQQPPSKQSKADFLKTIAKFVLTTTCSINPTRLMLISENLTEKDLLTVKDYCMKFIPKHHLPYIEISREFYPYWVSGLIHATISYTCKLTDLTL